MLPSTSRSRICLLSEIAVARNHCFVARLPDDALDGDDLQNSFDSDLRLFEDDLEIGPGHTLHESISNNGAGAFSHWGRHLYFSSSDGSDPRTNGRKYIALYGPQSQDRHLGILSAAMAVATGSLTEEDRYAWAERVFSAFAPGVKVSEYGRSFFTDQEFLSDYERFDMSNYRSFDRKFALKELTKLAIGLPGDFAECGVFRGASAFLLAKQLALSAPKKRLHLFDSFSGLSEPGAFDGSHWSAGALSCSLANVAESLAEYAGYIEFHPGWIPERFNDVGNSNFAFLHIDVDLYQPTRDSLEFFGPRIVPGGLIVCDDYGFETCPGARRAVDEYATARDLPVVHLPTGQGVVFFRGRSR